MFSKNTLLSAVAASSLFLLSAAALAAPAAVNSPLVQETCRADLNLSPADNAFQACSFSLADMLTAAPVTTVGKTLVSYSAKPDASRQAREDAACSDIGYEAGKAAHASCVASLDAALLRAAMLNK